MSSRLFDCSLMIGLLLAVIVSKVAADRYSVRQFLSPSVHPVEHFDEASDAKILADLIMSGSRQEGAINKLLVERSAVQRESIIYAINRIYGNTVLFTVLIRFAHGNYGEAMSSVLSRPLFLYSNELHKAIVHGDEDTILEILLSVDRKVVSALLKDYKSQFNATFVDNVKKTASSKIFGDIAHFLAYNRQETCVLVVPNGTKKAAKDLSKLLEGTTATNATALTAILTDICYPELQMVDQEYFKLTGHNIQAALDRKFEANVAANFHLIVRFAKNSPEYFSMKLNKAIHHTGGPILSDIDRIIIARSEIDLNDIQRAYKSYYSTTLADDLATVTDGEHQKLLLAFLGKF